MSLPKTLIQNLLRYSRSSRPNDVKKTLYWFQHTRATSTLDPFLGRIPTTLDSSRNGVFPISVANVRRLLRVSRVGDVKARLSGVKKDFMTYNEFLEICRGGGGGGGGGGNGIEYAIEVAKCLDESGEVIVLGNVVLLRPQQVARAIEGMIPWHINNHITSRHYEKEEHEREEELREMEKKKAEIDEKANARVIRELWLGFGFMGAQTLGFMRLTFWELTWDVMEPICFYVASFYFMVGYFFFLRTSKDPSFESVFQVRFANKQRRLMKAANFDVKRFHDLRRSHVGRQSNFERFLKVY